MAGRLRLHIGWSNRLGWYEGFRLLVAVNPVGVVTGFGFSAASTTDQQVAETLFAGRHQPDRRLPSVGCASQGPYVAYSRVSRAPRTISGGTNATGRKSSIRPNAEQPQTLVQALEALGGLHPPELVEGVDGVPDRLGAASQTPGDLRRGLSARTRQKYLGSAHHGSVFGAQPRLVRLSRSFSERERTNIAHHTRPSLKMH
jgi:hypothetical protein